MRCKIIEKATDMFLTLGVKSVTMDDIANESGMSKKTIYQYFKNKSELIQNCVDHIFSFITDGIECVRNRKLNAIEEHFEIKTFILRSLKNEKTSPSYQLQKYYPKIYDAMKERQFEYMRGWLSDNLKRGIEQGLYRNDINTEIISRIHFNSMYELKNALVFPPQQFSMMQLLEEFLEYHIRGIATPEGVDALERIINEQTINKTEQI